MGKRRRAAHNIRIQSGDGLEVTGAPVTLTDSSGTVLEPGPAVKTESGTAWNYTATTDLPLGQHNSIEVTATDRPGHKTTKAAAKSQLTA
jgi:hypothetical protein